MDRNHIVCIAMDSCRYRSLVTADQGGLSGEGGDFGHSPIIHESASRSRAWKAG